MKTLGLIKEGKTPPDNRVALTPQQCKWLMAQGNFKIMVESSATRCFSDDEYKQAGIPVVSDVSTCDILLGIKEVPVEQLIPEKTYMFFSHTKKKQPYNQKLMQVMVAKKITLIDYECLTYEDGQRIIGFGFFAGVVGAHNGMMAYGNRTKTFHLDRVYKQKDYRTLIHTYFGLKLPPVKIVVTGSGRVTHGIIEVMNMMDVQEVEPDEFLQGSYSYPVFTQLKGSNLYLHRDKKTYVREHFHQHPEEYDCLFEPYCFKADILMNGIYWEKNMPVLFTWNTIQQPEFNLVTIADITDDAYGSVPCNLGDATIENPVYGVNKQTRQKTEPYLPNGIDVMAVGNLPNELPRDASRYFGEQLIKYVFNNLEDKNNTIIMKATILENGQLTPYFNYLEDYAYTNNNK